MPMETRKELTPLPTLTGEPDESTMLLTVLDSEPPSKPTNPEPPPVLQQLLSSPAPMPDQLLLLSIT
ncbi:unnamed protein product [Larinioides sclopetarius]|uniref:Uncharacterized protein n=1 Tax=Larinioides sclopetarius TaxID=280406 RepID=A0AAV2AUJ2_9ARAC